MRLVLSALLLLFMACGLAENPRDEENKFIYITFSDPAFERYCLDNFDTNHDGRLSRYEAQRVLAISCPDLGIASMVQISEFTNLRTLDCRNNDLTALDLRACTQLRTVDCSRNRLASLDVSYLRGLVTLRCSQNDLRTLDLATTASLSTLVCRANPLTILDVSACSRTMESVDARDCPSLTTLYIARGQQVAAQVGAAQIVEL